MKLSTYFYKVYLVAMYLFIFFMQNIFLLLLTFEAGHYLLTRKHSDGRLFSFLYKYRT